MTAEFSRKNIITVSMHKSETSLPIHRLLLSAWVFLPLLAACSQAPSCVEEKFILMNQSTIIRLPYEQKAEMPGIQHSLQQTFANLQKLFDPYADRSEISTINRTAGVSRVPISADTQRLLRHCMDYSTLSDGAFDITAAPLLALWGFSGGLPPSEPLPYSIRHAAVQTVGSKQINLLDRSVGLSNPFTQIDLAHIAGSYALDIAILRFRARHTESLFIQHGKSVRTLGLEQAGTPWTRTLLHPETRMNLGTLLFTDLPACHWEYLWEEKVEIQQQAYPRHISPLNGAPVTNTLMVVTAARSATKAAALAQALMVSDLEDMAPMIERFQDCIALVIPNREPLHLYLSEHADSQITIAPEFQGAVGPLPRKQ